VKSRFFANDHLVTVGLVLRVRVSKIVAHREHAGNVGLGALRILYDLVNTDIDDQLGHVRRRDSPLPIKLSNPVRRVSRLMYGRQLGD
jgi:hypothetical protein